jgi:hypothetical protein
VVKLCGDRPNKILGKHPHLLSFRLILGQALPSFSLASGFPSVLGWVEVVAKLRGDRLNRLTRYASILLTLDCR